MESARADRRSPFKQPGASSWPARRSFRRAVLHHVAVLPSRLTLVALQRLVAAFASSVHGRGKRREVGAGIAPIT
jgi:hypothetical protein